MYSSNVEKQVFPELDKLLLPCPFCGNSHVNIELKESYSDLNSIRFPSTYYVRCMGCGIMHGQDTSELYTIKRWNKRSNKEYVELLKLVTELKYTNNAEVWDKIDAHLKNSMIDILSGGDHGKNG